MVEIGRTLISDDIFEKHFVCDLLKCKGACCIDGDSGAFLTDDEAATIERDYHAFETYLPLKHIEEIKKQGYSVVDSDGDLVTPLVNNEQCVYSYRNENGILKCGIEKAYLKGEISFRKPISCHLFPIRITEYEQFDAVNYQELDICKPARVCGLSHKLPLFKFLQEPLIRKYGHEWFAELEIAAEYTNSKT